jgi:Uma2 family endonuclease
MGLTTLESLGSHGMRLFQLSVSQYHKMMEQGILPEGEPFELLNGVVVKKDRSAIGENAMTVGHDHIYSVTVLQELTGRLKRHGCHVRIQQPVSIPPINEPEPDAAIVRGTKEDYADKLPDYKDTLCVIEVADASLNRDRTTKLQIYARGGITTYYIVNLKDRAVELYTNPLPRKAQYASTRIFSITEKITFPTSRGKGLTISVPELLPPAISRPIRRKRSAS